MATRVTLKEIWSSQPTSTRIQGLDLAKGIAMLLVIYDHTNTGCWSSVGGQMLDTIEVSLFFILSGMTWRPPQDIRKWIKRKFSRLVIPLVFFLGLGAAVLWGIREGYAAKNAVYDMLTGASNGPMWFVRALIWALIFYWALNVRCHNKLSAVGLYSVIAAIGGWGLGYYITMHPGSSVLFWLLASGFAQGLIALPLMWFGEFLSHIRLTQNASLRSWKWVLLCVAALSLWILLSQPRLHLHLVQAQNPWVFYIAAAAGGLVILSLALALRWLPGINYIGRYSLVFLGIQLPIIFILRHLGMEDGVGLFAAATGAAFILSWPVMHFLPFLR